MNRKSYLSLILPMLLIFFSCSQKSKSKTDNYVVLLKLDTIEPVTKFKAWWPDVTLDSLCHHFDTIHIAGKLFFLTEGDILLTESEIRHRLSQQTRFAANFSQQLASLNNLKQRDTTKPVIITNDFQEIIITYDPIKMQMVKWGHFPIRFCINKNSFSSIPLGYETIKDNFKKAFKDWDDLTNVSFDYVEEADESDVPESFKPDFIIQYNSSNTNPDYIATSFFPNDSASQHLLIVYPTYWTTNYDKTGILRHEIGHILGFIHEQSAKSQLVPLECRRKPDPFIPNLPLTRYDKKSLMHYFCGGSGTLTMQFSQSDTIGIRNVYGTH